MKKAIISMIIIAVVILSGIFVYKTYNKKRLAKQYESSFTAIRDLYNDIKIAALNKDGTKLIFKAESTKVIEKVKFVSETATIGEAVINSDTINTILDVPNGTEYLNIHYLNEKDNSILVTLNQEETYIDTSEEKEENWVFVRNKAGIKSIEYYVNGKLNKIDLESGQKSKELYVPLNVKEITVENGFGEKVTFDIKNLKNIEEYQEIIEENSSSTDDEDEDDFSSFFEMPENYSTKINIP